MSQILDSLTLKDTKTGKSTEYTLQDSTLKARVDNLVANAGNTDNNAELIDIRVGEDGTQYPTAGEAVRGQVSKLKDDLVNYTQVNENTYNLKFGYVNEEGTYANTKTKSNAFTPLLYLPKGSKVTFVNPLTQNNMWLNLYVYGMNLTYIEKYNVLCDVGKIVYWIAEDDCFARISVSKQYAVTSTNDELALYQTNLKINACSIYGDKIPFLYADNVLKIGIDTLQHYDTSVGNVSGDFRFCYQTDMHYSSTGTYGTISNARNLVNIGNTVNANFIASLGDSIHGYSNREQNKTDYAKLMSIYRNTKHFLPVQGNHENGTLYTFSISEKRSIDEIIQRDWFHRMYFKDFCLKENGCIDNDVLYYYVDYDNIRVVVLDTNDLPEEVTNSDGKLIFASGYQAGVRQSQLEWLINALSVSSEKSVIVLSHHSLSAGTDEDTNTVYNANAVRGILEAFKNGTSYTISQNPYGGTYFEINVSCDFSEFGTHDVIGCFAGHTHKDSLYEINGINYIVSDSSVPDTSVNKNARQSNATSDVIETVIVDFSTKTVNIIRFGYGFPSLNRTFNY